MLTIRLFRVGRKHQPAFKIVVTDKLRSSTRGRFVEEVGIYNPLTKQRNLKGDRVRYWISVGAKPSPTVHNMLITEKIIEGEKIAKHKLPKKTGSAEAAPSAEAKPQEITPEAAPVTAEQKPAETPKNEEAPAKPEAPVADATPAEEKKEENPTA